MKTIFIAGAPTSGKTTLATRLSAGAGTALIHTDGISFSVPPITAGYDAATFHREHTIEEKIAKERQYAANIFKELSAYIQMQTAPTVIVEGIAIDLQKASEIPGAQLVVCTCMPTDQALDKIIAERGLWDHPSAYPSQLLRLDEIEYVRAMDDMFRTLGKQTGALILPWQQTYSTASIEELLQTNN